MSSTDGRKRSLPLMLVTLLALAAFIAWRMASVHAGSDETDRVNAAPLQAGSAVTVRQESYACTSPELLSRSVAFKLAGAEDKLRALVQQHDCVLVLQQRRMTLAAVQDKLAQVESDASSAPLWMAVRDLEPVSK